MPCIWWQELWFMNTYAEDQCFIKNIISFLCPHHWKRAPWCQANIFLKFNLPFCCLIYYTINNKCLQWRCDQKSGQGRGLENNLELNIRTNEQMERFPDLGSPDKPDCISSRKLSKADPGKYFYERLPKKTRARRQRQRIASHLSECLSHTKGHQKFTMNSRQTCTYNTLTHKSPPNKKRKVHESCTKVSFIMPFENSCLLRNIQYCS